MSTNGTHEFGALNVTAHHYKIGRLIVTVLSLFRNSPNDHIVSAMAPFENSTLSAPRPLVTLNIKFYRNLKISIRENISYKNERVKYTLKIIKKYIAS